MLVPYVPVSEFAIPPTQGRRGTHDGPVVRPVDFALAGRELRFQWLLGG
jgi:hypothetical protein